VNNGKEKEKKKKIREKQRKRCPVALLPDELSQCGDVSSLEDSYGFKNKREKIKEISGLLLQPFLFKFLL